jgi:hypothetical protein
MPSEIRSNVRFGGWYQLHEGEPGDGALHERMQLIALSDWLRYSGRREVVVTATERGTGAAASVVLGAFVFRGA